jgi:DNA-binding winged helix-turn-helix (wHTH) protein
MREQDPCIYEFGGYRLEPTRRLLWRNGELVPLKSKPLDTLIVLVDSPGRLLTKEELMGALWPDTAVEENNLTQCISALRRFFGE